MRIFQQLGVAEQMRRHARDLPDYEFRAADGQVLMQLAAAARRRRPAGPAATCSTSRAWRACCATSSRPRRASTSASGQRLDGLVQDADGVTATIATPTGAGAIRARYLVGCDGAWSPVREAIGGGLFDYQFDEPWLVVDVKVGAGCRMPDVNLQICDPARPTTCVLSGPGRHRWEFMLLPGETPEADDGRRLRPGASSPLGLRHRVEIERKAVYRFHGLVADRWRDGRAADRRRRRPPDAAVRRAGHVLGPSRRGQPGLEARRRPSRDGVGRCSTPTRPSASRTCGRLIELAIGMGRVVCTLDPAAAAARRSDAGGAGRRRAAAAAMRPRRSPPAA